MLHAILERSRRGSEARWVFDVMRLQHGPAPRDPESLGQSAGAGNRRRVHVWKNISKLSSLTGSLSKFKF